MTTRGGAPAGGAGAAGAGGDGGLPPVTLATIAGDWSGGIMNTYVCETNLQPFTFDVDGSSVSVTGWPYERSGAGTIVQLDDGSFTFDLEYEEVDEYNPAATLHGQFVVEPAAHHAMLVLQDLGSAGGKIAILQRGATVVPNPSIAGTWAGPTLRLDNDFQTTEVLSTTATFSELDEAWSLSGEDDDGTFEGSDGRYNENSGNWSVRPIEQDGKTYGGFFLLSADQTTLAAALLERTSDDIYYNELCDLGVFSDLSIHKFGFWTRQP
jgi:hypothetical protein